MRSLTKSRLALLVSAALLLPALGAASFVNYDTREINLKVVYDGPDRELSRGNLVHVYEKTSPDAKGKLVQLSTESKDKLFFDYLPLSLGEIRGFKTRFHLYRNIPEGKYEVSRRLIFKGVDGVVFVADSDPSKLAANQASFARLKTDLASLGLDLKKIPLVVQLGNRAHPKALSKEKLVAALKLGAEVPVFEAELGTGVGVFDTLKAIAKLTLMELKKTAGPADAGGH